MVGGEVVNDEWFLAMNYIFMQTLSICWSSRALKKRQNVDISIIRHTNFAPSLKGRYLSSNVNITLLNENGQVETVPVGSQFHLPSTICNLNSNQLV